MKNSTENKKIGRTQRQIEQVKLQMGIVMDDTHFKNLVNETQVIYKILKNIHNFNLNYIANNT